MSKEMKLVKEISLAIQKDFIEVEDENARLKTIFTLLLLIRERMFTEKHGLLEEYSILGAAIATALFGDEYTPDSEAAQSFCTFARAVQITKAASELEYFYDHSLDDGFASSGAKVALRLHGLIK